VVSVRGAVGSGWKLDFNTSQEEMFAVTDRPALVGIIGAGNIGGNLARRLALAGHDVMVSFARDRARLAALAADIGATVGEPADAAAADVVVLSVPWGVIETALAAAGPMVGRIVVDTTNQYGRGGVLDLGHTAARDNADRMPGARYAKCFNTLTAGFQAQAATRSGDARVVQWICGDDTDAKAVLARLVEDAGYVPVDLGGIDQCSVMEAPRRPGAVYGEEYRAADAAAVVDAVRAGRPIPPTPTY
jgi:8-hydroxy-5-deazaflavin:NADPH oxidoreductase